MLIILSPAKSLDYSSKNLCKKFSNPLFLNEAEILAKNLSNLTLQNVIQLMSISESLAKTNYQRFLNFSEAETRQAILAFDGDVYQGIAKDKFLDDDFDFAQKHLRILSGLYGLLRPLDLIKPYRLEMGTDFKKINFFIKNLYEFWQEKITNEINKDGAKFLVNLASEEYFTVIDKKNITKPIINITFLQKKNNEFKNIGINSKKARGLMSDFLIRKKVTNISKIKDFSAENYHFDENFSHKFSQKISSEQHLVFIR